MIDEQLSAFLDEESDATEIKRAIRALQGDAEYRHAWQRQLLVREVLHSDNAMPAVDAGLADRVTAALNAEATDSDKVVPMWGRKVRGPRWWQGAAGLATAASIAAAVVLVVQPFAAVDGVKSAEPTMVAVAGGGESNTATDNAPTVARADHDTYEGPGMATDSWTVSDPAVAKQLNSYLLEHNGLANGYGLFGARPSFVRVAAYGWNSGR